MVHGYPRVTRDKKKNEKKSNTKNEKGVNAYS